MTLRRSSEKCAPPNSTTSTFAPNPNPNPNPNSNPNSNPDPNPKPNQVLSSYFGHLDLRTFVRELHRHGFRKQVRVRARARVCRVRVRVRVRGTRVTPPWLPQAG